MPNGIRCFAVTCLAAFLIVGCGGSGGSADSADDGATTAGDGATTASTAASDGSTTAAPDAEASTATTVTEPPSGGAAAGVCELVTADELAQIFNVPSVKTTVFPGPPDNCIVESDAGDPLAAWSLTTAQASSVFDAFTSDPATIEVSGIGDKAAFVQNTGLLVLKGDNLVVISVSGGADLSEEEAMEASKQLGVFAAGRV
jgi:hypothetical protein